MLPCSQTIIYENLTTNCKCMLCHCTSKPTEGMAKMFKKIKTFKTKPRIQKLAAESAEQQQTAQLPHIVNNNSHSSTSNHPLRKPPNP